MLVFCVALSLFLKLGVQGDLITTPEEDNVIARGAQVRLTKSGLQYLANIELLHFKEAMTNLKVADQKGGASHFTFIAKDILIKKLRTVSQSIKPISGVGLLFHIDGMGLDASMTVTIKYEKGWVKLSDTTKVTISASQVSFSVTEKVDANKGKAHVSTSSCEADVGQIHLHFEGGLQWLYELLRTFLENKLKEILSEQFCTQAQKLVDGKGNAVLASLPMRTNIKDYAYIDYSFQQPLFTNNYLDLYFRGEFLDLKHPVHSKLVPPQFETTSSSAKMIYIWFTDYSLNTAADVFHKSQLLQKVITIDDKIPPGVKPFLNTATLQQFIPKLYEKFPDRPIHISLETFRAPHFRLGEDLAHIDLYVRAGINVVLANKKLVQVFHIDISVSANIMASIQMTNVENSGYNIGGLITSYTFNLDVGGSVIGAVNLPVNNKSIKDMVRGLVVDQANPLLDRGFPLPTSRHLILKQPSLSLVTNAIRIDAMVEYHLHPKD